MPDIIFQQKGIHRFLKCVTMFVIMNMVNLFINFIKFIYLFNLFIYNCFFRAFIKDKLAYIYMNGSVNAIWLQIF